MNLVKNVVQLRLAEVLQPWREIRGLVRVASGDDKGEVNAAPMVIDNAREKKRITIQVKAITIEHQSDGPLEESQAATVGILERFNKESALPKVAFLRQEAVFIEPANVALYDLVDVLKRLYLKPTKVSESATDLGLVFDKHEEGDVVKGISFGPMDRTQIQQDFLRWPKDNLPETFVFANMVYQIKGPESVTKETLELFFHDAASWYKSASDALMEDLKGGGQW